MKLKAVTLVELIIVITLLGVIVLGAMAFDSVSRRFLWKTDIRSEALNEATLVLDHIAKSALTGIGDLDRPALWLVNPGAGNEMLVIRSDTTPDGIYNTANDNCIAYYRNGINLRRCVANDAGVCPGGTFETISPHITSFTVTGITGNTAIISVTARSTSPDPTIPPEVVTINTTIEVPAQSIQ